MNKKLFYLTTTLPYVNADPHVGFSMEIIRADVIARYHRSLGEEIFFNTGTDEHGAKIYENAVKEGKSPQSYVDGYAERFKEQLILLNISEIHFIRTTDEKHVLAAQEMWKRCFEKGDIYKKLYKVKYCIGCELEKTDSELVDGKCSIHPNRDIEIREEENYFFRWSKYQEPLLAFYETHPDFVVPDFRFNEIKAFVARGLEDFSISRLKSKMPWGVAVPRDEEHVMYVWFDALTSYISTLGWGTGEADFDFWKEGTPVQYCGKDNNRQQSAMWQAMLMSAGLPQSSHIVINGFINSGGQKMSKSLGNVISPFDVIDLFKGVTDFPEDVLRFVLLHDISSFEDGDLTLEGIKTSYTAYLANGIGNLTSRIMKMVSLHKEELNKRGLLLKLERTIYPEIKNSYEKSFQDFNLNEGIHVVFSLINRLDERIQSDEAFKVIKTNFELGTKLVIEHVNDLINIVELLEPFLPRTSAKIIECIHENKMPEKPLFNRLA